MFRNEMKRNRTKPSLLHEQLAMIFFVYLPVRFPQRSFSCMILFTRHLNLFSPKAPDGNSSSYSGSISASLAILC